MLRPYVLKPQPSSTDLLNLCISPVSRQYYCAYALLCRTSAAIPHVLGTLSAPVATSRNRCQPAQPLFTPFASSDLFGPPCASMCLQGGLSRTRLRSLVSVLDTHSLPTQLGLFYLVSGAMVIHLTRILYPVFNIRSVTCFVPVLHSRLRSQLRLSSQFRSRNRLLHSRNGCFPEDPGCYSEDPGHFSEDPGCSPEGSVASPKVLGSKAPVLKPSRRGMYAVNLSRQAYLRRRFVHCLLSSVYYPRFIVLGSIPPV